MLKRKMSYKCQKKKFHKYSLEIKCNKEIKLEKKINEINIKINVSEVIRLLKKK